MRHYEHLNSNNKVGRAAGIPPRTVGRIINLEVQPQIDTLELLAGVFEIDAWCLLVPDLDPANPPYRAMTVTERKLYAGLTAAAKAVEEANTPSE